MTRHADLSREFELELDASGRVAWLDERARLVLLLDVGATLVDHAAPGSGDKLARLIADPAVGDAGWEVIFTVAGAPRAVSLRAGRRAERVALVGTTADDSARALEELADNVSAMAELHRASDRQQRELLVRHEELVRLHRELESSYRGVVALHAEVADKDASLRQADDIRARMVTNVSHEFRTPLNSILGLTRLLLDRSDGDLTAEQEKQLGFITSSAQALSTLVNDLLDYAKIDSQKTLLHARAFSLFDFLDGLSGMLAPLPRAAGVDFVVERPEQDVELETDDGKLGQVLRNLISNALKFTQQGAVRVRSRADGDAIVFSVEDTGIGVAPEHQRRIFEEFFQVDHDVQRRVRGTGLGLALTNQLTTRLCGSISVTSEAGRGSTFTVRVPRRHPEVAEMHALEERSANPPVGAAPILVLEDDRHTLFLYEKYLRGSGFHVVPARTIDDARAALRRMKPAAIVLDVLLENDSSWSFLRELKSDPATRDIPALVVTVSSREDNARALGADEFYMKPLDRDWLLAKLRAVTRQKEARLLVIDDDPVARYLVRKHLDGSAFSVMEADGGAEGVRLAREHLPDAVLLDFVMPGMSAFDVLDELKKDPATRGIPVIIHTSKSLEDEERKRLEVDSAAILSKQSLSREIAIARIRDVLTKGDRPPTRPEARPA